MKSMRTNISDLIDVGRAMECIAKGIRSVRATGAVNDELATAEIRSMRLAAQKMVTALKRIEDNLEDAKEEAA